MELDARRRRGEPGSHLLLARNIFSLGWNFCEYGFFKMEGLAWGWVICGIVFVLVGKIPIYILLRKVSARELLEAVRSNFGAIWPQLLAMAAAALLGVIFFRAVS